MNIVIFGSNSIALNVARRFARAGEMVTVLSHGETDLLGSFESAGCDIVITLKGDLQPIIDAGKLKPDAFIALTNDSEANLMYCNIMKLSFGVKNRIAKVHNYEYFPEAKCIDKNVFNHINKMGKVISLENLIADRVLFNSKFMNTKNVFKFFDDKYIFANLVVVKNCIKQEDLEKNHKVAIIGTSRLNIFKRREEKKVLQKGDNIYIVATKRNLNNIAKEVINANISTKTTSCVIGGGDYTGRAIISKVSKKIKQITVIEKNENTAIRLTERFANIDVLHSNISDWIMMENAGVGNADLYISTSSNGSANIISAVVAKGIGCKRSICILLDVPYDRTMGLLDVDAIINANSIFADEVVSSVYSAGSAKIGSFYQDKLFCCELNVRPKSVIIGKKPNQVSRKYNINIIAVRNKDNNFITLNDELNEYKINEKDTLLFWCHVKHLGSIKKIALVK
ncbi:MAG: NAD-binding protein [Alphaproteobacteria bacterium]|nr:NAD-binding protein [Rickettsiales bacterium]